MAVPIEERSTQAMITPEESFVTWLGRQGSSGQNPYTQAQNMGQQSMMSPVGRQMQAQSTDMSRPMVMDMSQPRQADMSQPRTVDMSNQASISSLINQLNATKQKGERPQNMGMQNPYIQQLLRGL